MAISAATNDHYAVLEVPKTASADDIKAAWKGLAIIRHPDKNLGNPNATAEFQQLQSAYKTLSDPFLRRAYNNGPSTGTFTNSGGNSGRYSEMKCKRDILLQEKRTRDSHIVEATKALNNIVDEINKLDRDEKKDIADEPSRRGYISPTTPGSRKQHREESPERSARRLNRVAAKRIKEEELKKQKAELINLKLGSRNTQTEIDKITLEMKELNKEQHAGQTKHRKHKEKKACRKEEEKAKSDEEEPEREQVETETQEEKEDIFTRRDARRKKREAKAAKKACEKE